MMNKKRTFTIMTVFSMVYLVIEIQAWFFLSKIYHTQLTLEELSQFERFGYASAALGITLLFARLSMRKTSNSKQKGLILLFLVPVYLTSLWTSYEIVERSPDWLPDSYKPRVLQASIKTLESPQWKNLLGLFNENEKGAGTESIKRAQENFRASDKQIQSIYIDGLRTTAMFADYYERSAETMDRQLWSEIWRGAYSESSFGGDNDFSYHHLKKRLQKLYVDQKEAAYLFRGAERAGLLLMLQTYDPILYQRMVNNEAPDSPPTMSDVELYKNELRNALSWKTLGEQLDIEHWPAYNPDQPVIMQFQKAYSRAVLDKYTHLPNTVIPWYSGSPLNTAVYHKAAAQVTPFLFYENGKSVLTLSKVYDDDIRFQYVGTLRRELPELLRSHWDAYQVRALRDLSTSEAGWHVPSNDALHKKWLRAGFVLPLMLILSTLLLVTNLFIMFRQSIGGCLIVAVTGTLMITGLSSTAGQWMLNLILSISVSEAKIFLY